MESTIAPSAEKLVLDALDDHALPEVIAAASGLSMLQTLRILQELKEKGLAERYGAECWGKRRG